MSEKEDPVVKDHIFIIGVIAVIVVGFLIIISVYNVVTGNVKLEHPDKWYVYIYEFQTLIGGLLAVGAAFITVRQMRKSDERADLRHNALMKLQKRPVTEGLAALRHHYSERLFFGSFHLRKQIENWDQCVEGTTTKMNYNEIQSYFTHADAIVLSLEELFEEPTWNAHQSSMNGRDQSAVGKLRRNLEQYQDASRHLGKYLEKNSPEEINSHQLKELLPYLKRSRRWLDEVRSAITKEGA